MSGAQHTPKKWEGHAIGLLDLDAFFASVEQLDHPEWRGKPVIVGGDANRRGVVSTASYEARKYGVHSAMSAAQAQKLCPHAIWTHGNYARYRQMSDAVMQILVNETPYVEQVSIDEAFFDVTPGAYANEDPAQICARVQARVAELGITCSIGLSTSKSVAKIASEQHKPRGLTVVPADEVATFMAPLPVRALSGIGPSTEKALKSVGIRTLGELARSDEARLVSLLGVHGAQMRARARGEEGSPVSRRADPDEVKSVSNERTFATDLTAEDDIRAAIGVMAAKVGQRLRKKQLSGRTVTLKLLFGYRQGHTAQSQLARPTNDEAIFGRAAQELLHQIWHEGTPVRLVGVGVSGFADEDTSEQMTLFGGDEGQSLDKGQPRLNDATDRIRERFGASALSYGRELRFVNGTTGTASTSKPID